MYSNLIEIKRENFYLDSDKVSRYKYKALVTLNSNLPVFKVTSDLTIPLGQCEVCGKNPIVYNFILEYTGNEKPYKYVSVGSECVQFLDKSDMLKFNQDKRELLRQLHIDKVKRLARLLDDYKNTHKMEIIGKTFYYNGKDRDLYSGLEWIINMFLDGNTLENSDFYRTIKKSLKDYFNFVPKLKHSEVD